MRIGIDYWPATTHAPGVGRYVRELVRALALRPDAPELALFEVGPGARTLPAESLGLQPFPRGWRRCQAELPRRALGPLARLGLGAERLLGGCELFHQVRPGEPPLGRLPRVLALSELSGPAAPLDAAALGPLDVVVFSAAARRELLEARGLEPERVHALPVGADHWVRESGLRAARGPAARVVVLGRTDAARAPLAVLTACEILLEGGRELRLDWCGRPGDAADAFGAAIERSRWRERLRWTRDPREAALPRLVAAADALVHLNEEEWTPVTPLEAMRAGAAVVASRLPAFEEALEDRAHWIEGRATRVDPADLAATLDAALDSGGDAQARQRRRQLAEPYTWDRHAALTAALWRRILARR